MDDIRDKFPMPPCVMCGRGMCVKSDSGEGYRCPTCGQGYEIEPMLRPATDTRPSSLRPMALYFRLALAHWRGAMEHAMETLDPVAMIEAMNTHRRWMDEVVLEMAGHVNRLKNSEQPEPVTETGDDGWLSDERLREMR